MPALQARLPPTLQERNNKTAAFSFFPLPVHRPTIGRNSDFNAVHKEAGALAPQLPASRVACFSALVRRLASLFETFGLKSRCTCLWLIPRTLAGSRRRIVGTVMVGAIARSELSRPALQILEQNLQARAVIGDLVAVELREENKQHQIGHAHQSSFRRN
jgi:hypothetical protein